MCVVVKIICFVWLETTNDIVTIQQQSHNNSLESLLSQVPVWASQLITSLRHSPGMTSWHRHSDYNLGPASVWPPGQGVVVANTTVTNGPQVTPMSPINKTWTHKITFMRNVLSPVFRVYIYIFQSISPLLVWLLTNKSEAAQGLLSVDCQFTW